MEGGGGGFLAKGTIQKLGRGLGIVVPREPGSQNYVLARVLRGASLESCMRYSVFFEGHETMV